MGQVLPLRVEARGADIDQDAGEVGRIYLDAEIRLSYLPRASVGGLARQYFNYGKGRARTLMKHGERPKLRQLIPPATLVACVAGLAIAPFSLWGLVLLYVAVNLPFTIWLLYGFVLQVPVELEEAAAIDGCGPLRVFTKVLLPLMAPGLAAASIFAASPLRAPRPAARRISGS